MAAKEVGELKLQLAKASAKDPLDAERVVDLLNLLGKVPMTLDLLKSTKVGKLVNGLRKKSEVTVSKKANELTSAWKAVLKKAMSAKAAGGKAGVKLAAPVQAKKEEEQVVADKKDAPAPDSGAPAAYKLGETGSNMRDKIQTLILKALGKPDPSFQADCKKTAVDLTVAIEAGMFAHCKGTNDAYKAKYRVLSFALKDKSTPQLNADLFKGRLEADAFAAMSSEELASDEMRQKRQAEYEFGRESARSDHQTGSFTDQFLCEKCNGRKSTYTMVQTRGADEPMTVFVACLLCGHEWIGGDNDGN